MLDIGSHLTTAEASLSLNMTPMIDVVFNLLIFFLLTLAFTRPIFEVDLPGAAYSQLEQNPKQPLIVSLQRGGRIFVDEVAVPVEHLQGHIEQALTQDPIRPVVLQADQQSPFCLFIAVMDATKGAGADQLVIETTRAVGGHGDAP